MTDLMKSDCNATMQKRGNKAKASKKGTPDQIFANQLLAEADTLKERIKELERLALNPAEAYMKDVQKKSCKGRGKFCS